MNASMRPEDFSPGNPRGAGGRRRPFFAASMRPEDFSPGNRSRPRAAPDRTSPCFNEAGGFLPRKPTCCPTAWSSFCGFNEAGGFLPRKLPRRPVPERRRRRASMRPEDFSPGNNIETLIAGARAVRASMRPEDFSPGNRAVLIDRGHVHVIASMRPEDFSPGNMAAAT